MTLTFFFSDLEDSSGLADRLDAGYAAVLAEARELQRRAIERAGGREVDCRGDELFGVFDAARPGRDRGARDPARVRGAHLAGAGARARADRPALRRGGAGRRRLRRPRRPPRLADLPGRTRRAGPGVAGGSGRPRSCAVEELGDVRLPGAARAGADLPAPRRRSAGRVPAAPRRPRARPRPLGGDRRRLDAAARGARRDCSRRRRSRSSARPERRRADAQGAQLPPRRRDRRHPHAADPDGRGDPGGPRDPREASRAPACSSSPSTWRTPTPSSCSPTAPRGSATCSRTASTDVDEFTAAVQRVAEGGSALDPLVVAELVGRNRGDDPIERLSPREREVLELMAEGRSNQAIGQRLFISPRAVEKHVTSIFTKLRLPAAARRPPARARRAALPRFVALPTEYGLPHVRGRPAPLAASTTGGSLIGGSRHLDEGRSSHAHDRGARSREELREDARPRRPRSRRRVRPGRGHARPERSRQDDRRSRCRDAAPARRRHVAGLRPRCAPSATDGEAADRPGGPVRGRRARDDRAREPRDGGPSVRPEPEDGPCERTTRARAARPGGARRPACAHLFGRHAPPSRSRREPGRAAAAAAPRRADDRAGSSEPDRALGCDPRSRRVRARMSC